jgi:hypothetical protein
VVYISGASGNKALVTKAQANSESTSSGTFAVISASISNNHNGTAVVAGELGKLDTTAFAEGATLYLSPTTAGAFTTTKPVAPNHIVYVATVTRVHANQGTIEVRIQNGSHLDEQADVLLTSNTNNDLLVYESATSLWKNKSFATLGLLTAPYNPFNQTLNTTDSPTFTGIQIVSGADSGSYGATSANIGQFQINGVTGEITFPDATIQTTAAPSIAGLATLASPTFTGNPIAPTPTAGDNDTSIATTAFVNTYCPAASTTTAGKVELATDAEAIAGTDTARAVTPSNLIPFSNRTNVNNYVANTFSASTSGTGSTTSQSNSTKLVAAPTSVVGYGTLINGSQLALLGSSTNAGFSWNQKIDFVCRYNRQQGTTDANSLFRILVGRSTTGYAAAGDPAVRCIGVRCVNGSAMELLAHDGTTLTAVSSSHTPTTQVTYDMRIISDGTGNVTLYIDGSQVATTSAGPTSSTVSGGNGIAFEAQNTGTVSGTKAQIQVSNFQVTIG